MRACMDSSCICLGAEKKTNRKNKEIKDKEIRDRKFILGEGAG
jgi:hypothetical protein